VKSRYAKCRIEWIAIAGLAACGSATSSQPIAGTKDALPAGATLEASGFATIGEAPPSPFPDQLPPPENRPKDETGFYARMAGISEGEAAKRTAEQHRIRPEFERLIGTLRKQEAGNFTDARMIHKPDWAFVLYFKRDPQATLARYTANPRFKAEAARYSQEELQALAKPWADRFMQHRLLGGYGTDATYGEVRMDLVVSKAEYDLIAEREGWKLPEAIKLEFAQAVEGLPIAEPVRNLVRIFPQSDRALGPTHQALHGGRIVLRDGCFHIARPNQPDRLAYFAQEVALGVDAQNYLSLQTRGAEPRHLGRIGEEFSWAGPIGINEDAPMVAELRKSCGNAPLEHVGVPDSSRLFHIRPHVIDAIAERRKIGRDEAWRRFKSCIEDKEGSRGGALIECDTL
jgi:hypothetical protein